MCASGVRPGHSLKKEWAPSTEAFRRFLSWLDEGGDSDGERYLDMRRRLVAFFQRKRCLAPDDLTDETFNRVARRLEEEHEITDGPPARYCYIVARYVFLEYLRSGEHLRSDGRGSAIDLEAQPSRAADPSFRADQELTCLDGCMECLADDDRSLILSYYSAEARQRITHRRALARLRGLTPNALNIRACRIRARLERCVKDCVDGY